MNINSVLVLRIIHDFFFTGNVGENDWYQEDVAIPETVRHNRKTYTVTAVGPLTFAGCMVGEVSLPGTITSIGEAAFENSALTSIDIPAAVTSIGRWAFTGTPYLERIHVDEGNHVYDSREDCNAIIETATNTLVQACKNTVIPASVTTIGEYAFGGDLGSFGVHLPEVYTLPATVTTICDFAFRECNMRKVNIPNSVTSLSNTFNGCTSLSSINIPNSVTNLYQTFYDCSNLSSIVIPNSITSINDSTFNNCTSLTSINIPSSVTSISNTAFIGCSGMASITVDANNTTYDSRDSCNAIVKTSDNKLIFGCKNTVIPSSVMTIGDNAFNSCTGLNSFSIPASVANIGTAAFSCYNNCFTECVPY